MVNNVPFLSQLGMLWEVCLLGRVVVEEAEFSYMEATLRLASVSSASKYHLILLVLSCSRWSTSLVPTQVEGTPPASCCGGVVTGTCGVFFCGRQAGGSGGAANRSGRRPGGSGR